MKQVHNTLQRLANTTSRKEKEDILRSEESDLLKRVLYVALNPFITYGVNQLPAVEGGLHNMPFGEAEWDLLELLAARRLTGNAAKAAIGLALGRLTLEEGDILTRILKKDLRAGIDISTVNKVFKDLIPSFSCMLAEPFDANRVARWPVIVQPKLDGVRTLVLVNTVTREVQFLSRSGKPLPALESLTDAVLDAAERNHLSMHLCGHQFVLDGEAVSGGFLKTVGDVRKKGKKSDDAVLTVFDALPGSFFSGMGERAGHQAYRLQIVSLVRSSCERVVPISSMYCNDADEVYEAYNEIRAKGGEGVIVKAPGAHYEKRRSYSWMKIKDCQSVDAPIVDVERGTGRLSDSAGAIVVDVEGVRVAVGSGLTDELRNEIWGAYRENPNSILGRPVEVAYHERTEYGSLRHPRFVKFRDVLSGHFE